MVEIDPKRTKVSATSFEDFKEYFADKIEEIELVEKTVKSIYNQCCSRGASYRAAGRRFENKKKSIGNINKIYNCVIYGSNSRFTGTTTMEDEESGESMEVQKTPWISDVIIYDLEDEKLKSISYTRSPNFTGERFEDAICKKSKVGCEHSKSESNGVVYENEYIKKIEDIENIDNEKILNEIYTLPEYIREGMCGKMGGYKPMVFYGEIGKFNLIDIWVDGEKSGTEEVYRETDDNSGFKQPCFKFNLRNKSVMSQNKVVYVEFPREYYGRLKFAVDGWSDEYGDELLDMSTNDEVINDLFETFSGMAVYVIGVPTRYNLKGDITYITIRASCVIELEEPKDTPLLSKRDIKERDRLRLTKKSSEKSDIKTKKKSTKKSTKKSSKKTTSNTNKMKEMILKGINLFGEDVTYNEMVSNKLIDSSTPEIIFKKLKNKIIEESENEKNSIKKSTKKSTKKSSKKTTSKDDERKKLISKETEESYEKLLLFLVEDDNIDLFSTADDFMNMLDNEIKKLGEDHLKYFKNKCESKVRDKVSEIFNENEVDDEEVDKIVDEAISEEDHKDNEVDTSDIDEEFGYGSDEENQLILDILETIKEGDKKGIKHNDLKKKFKDKTDEEINNILNDLMDETKIQLMEKGKTKYYIYIA